MVDEVVLPILNYHIGQISAIFELKALAETVKMRKKREILKMAKFRQKSDYFVVFSLINHICGLEF